MSEENVRLRECPFCGCEAAIESMPVKYHIFCVNCQANASDEYEEAVIGKWNTRAADQERDDLVALLVSGREVLRRDGSSGPLLNHMSILRRAIKNNEQTLAKIEKEEK